MKRILSSIALAAAALAVSAPASADPTFTFAASANQIGIGDSVTVTATITNLGTEVLAAFDLNFLYNSAVLDLSTWTFNAAALGGVDSFIDPLLTPGVAAFHGFSLMGPPFFAEAELAALQPGGAFELFSFELKGLADGVSTFTLGASPDFDRNFNDWDANSMNVAVNSICIAVGTGSCDNNVPEPATYGLAGVGLLAAGLAGRRRKAVQAKA